jgi:translation initiation factor IF-2
MSKVRIYDLAKELKLDNKKVIEEVRRFGFDVSVPSNSVPLDIAEKVKSKYFPQKSQAERRVKLVKHRADEQPESTPVAGVAAQPQLARSKPAEATVEEARPQAPPPSASQVRVVKKVERPAEEVLPPTPAPSTPPPPLRSAPSAPPAPVQEAEEAKSRIVRIEPPRPEAAPVATAQAPATPASAQPTVEPQAEPQMPAEPQVSIQAPPAAETKQAPESRIISSPSPSTSSSSTGIKTHIIQLQSPAAQMPSPNAQQATGVARPEPEQQRPAQRQYQQPQRPGQQPQRPGQQPQRPGQQPQRPGQPPQKLVSKPMAQVLHRVTAQPEGGEVPEGQRTTYIPPPDSRKKGRRSSTAQKPVHLKKEDREKLPMRQVPQSAPVAPKIAPPKELKSIKLVEGSTVKEFAEKLEVKPKDVVGLLLSKGVMATINQTLNADVAREIGREFGFEVSFAGFEEMTAEAEVEETIAFSEDSDRRAPVVTVMGHVDHGKTSLLDAIRKTRVAEGEAGGITQHIGAYTVDVSDPDKPGHNRRVVFLDTPGHEAFTMMRARGARATDVVVLVVAADDGVMPQTIEAIEHAKAANVPIVVAINKVDKPQAQPDRVKQALSDYGLVWDGWGGETVMVEVSAKQRINLDALLEMILLTADILDLKATPKRLGTGVVLEAKLDKGRGAVATVLIQNGTLRVGDPVIAGLFFGRVRAMFDDRGRPIQESGPSTPVEVLGLQGVPSAGDQFQVVTDVAKAQQISTLRQSKKRMLELSRSSAQRLEDLFSAMQAGKLKELLAILKTDVQGSVEVLKDTLQKLSTDKVKVRVIRSGVGAITESDVLLAAASNDMAHSAVIIGFNVRPEQRAEELAKLENVDIRLHTIIYKVEEEIRNAMIGMLEATVKEVGQGRAEVRKVIKIPKVGNVAGVMVLDGFIKRNSRVRLVRDGIVVHEGQINTLRRFKDDVSEVKQGFECGIGIEKFSDLKMGDIIEAYTMEKVTPTEL